MLPVDNTVERIELFQHGYRGLPKPTGPIVPFRTAPTMPQKARGISLCLCTMAGLFLRFNLCW